MATPRSWWCHLPGSARRTALFGSLGDLLLKNSLAFVLSTFRTHAVGQSRSRTVRAGNEIGRSDAVVLSATHVTSAASGSALRYGHNETPWSVLLARFFELVCDFQQRSQSWVDLLFRWFAAGRWGGLNL